MIVAQNMHGVFDVFQNALDDTAQIMTDASAQSASNTAAASAAAAAAAQRAAPTIHVNVKAAKTFFPATPVAMRAATPIATRAAAPAASDLSPMMIVGGVAALALAGGALFFFLKRGKR